MWKVISILLIVAWAIYGFFTYGPLPILDSGHRTFGVCDMKALRTVVEVIEATTSNRLDYVFEYGPTKQALFGDGYTVINLLENSACRIALGQSSGDAASFVVSEPKSAAEKAGEMFRQAGYHAQVEQVTDNLFLCRSSALNEADLVYRRHALRMGGPPKIISLD